MNINRLSVVIEPWAYVRSGLETIRVLKIKVERYPGEEVRLEEILDHDDLKSVWDHVWSRAGRQILALLEADNEKHLPAV